MAAGAKLTSKRGRWESTIKGALDEFQPVVAVCPSLPTASSKFCGPRLEPDDDDDGDVGGDDVYIQGI